MEETSAKEPKEEYIAENIGEKEGKLLEKEKEREKEIVAQKRRKIK